MEEKEIIKATKYWTEFGINNLDKVLEGVALLGLGLEYNRLGHPPGIAISEAGIDYLLLKSGTELGVGAFLVHLGLMELFDKVPFNPRKIMRNGVENGSIGGGGGGARDGEEEPGARAPSMINGARLPPRIYVKTFFSYYDPGTGRSVSKYCIMKGSEVMTCYGSRRVAEGHLKDYKVEEEYPFA